MATGGPSNPNTTPTVTNRQTLRIQRDLQTLTNNPLPFVKNLELKMENNLNQLTGVLIGPNDSDYANGEFKFIIQFPPEYPFKPPDFLFATKICHPNVESRTGTACHDQLLATWAPSITLTDLLTEMHSLLRTPNYQTPFAGDSLEPKTPEKAKQWTLDHAKPQ